MQIDRKKKCSFYLGEKENGEKYYCDCQDARHLIIAGGDTYTRQHFVMNIVNDLQEKTDAHNIKFIIFSKDSIFNKFKTEGILLNNTIYSVNNDFIAITERISKEIEERLKFLQINNYKNFNDYYINQEQHKKNFQNIFIIFDEIKEIMDCYKDELFIFIRKHLLMAGLVGIHFLFVTNYCSTDVLSGILKSAVISRIALKTNTKFESNIVIGTSDAVNLNKDEIYFLFNSKLIKLQIV